jgi:hypothetical protein
LNPLANHTQNRVKRLRKTVRFSEISSFFRGIFDPPDLTLFRSPPRSRVSQLSDLSLLLLRFPLWLFFTAKGVTHRR